LKLFISPHPNSYREDGSGSGGIWRVINAQARWLPELGVEIIDHQERADIVALHAGSLVETFNPVVVHNHGLYWTGDFPWRTEYWQYNASVIEALRRANEITTPSEWTALPIRRDMRKSPLVIPHGVNPDEFEPQSTNAGYSYRCCL
jgi:glycosyltransferase involved in cell wall biosynthesis